MEERAAFLEDVRYRLEQAQTLHKRHYDKHHREVSYNVGDWALLRLHHRAPASLQQSVTGKLKPKFYGPYHVTEIINDVTVRLELPPHARLHDVFHVGILKKFNGPPPPTPPMLPPIHYGAVAPEPERAVRYRLAQGVRQVLVQWKSQSTASATWEDVEPFLARFPAFQLEDELNLEGGGRDVMWGMTYTRRQRARDIKRAAECAARAASAQEEATTSG